MEYGKQLLAQSESVIRPLINELNQLHIEPPGDDEDYSNAMSRFYEWTSYQAYLRQYVDSWLEAGHNFGNWIEKYPDLHNELRDYLAKLRCALKPESDGRAHLAILLDYRDGLDPRQPQVRAVTDFIKLIRSLVFNRIGKCPRCHNYYLAQSARITKYCSTKCATTATAIESTRRRLDQEKEEKIKTVRKAIQQLKRLKRKPPNWKLWVENRTGITSKWITQAYNRGDLPNAKSLVERK